MEDTGSKLDPAGGADEDAAVFDFLSDLLDDQGGAGARPLAVYLARYPGHEEAIASEFLRATGQVKLALPADDGGDPETREGAARGSAALGSADGDGRVIGHYRLDRELGAGGQGAVWLSTDLDLGRQVALKLMTTPFVTEERRRRFRREAESIARLDHPSLAGVHDADVDAEPPWIAMRYVEGADLSRQLESARAALEAGPPRLDGPGHLPLIPGTRAELARVLRFFERAARALHAAHEEGLVHRDIKPANLMVAPSGDPVVLDFGLARMAESEGVTPDPALTREGEVFGTPAYMAPEQLSGGAAESSPGVDVWALGVSLHEALTGQRPFQGEGPHDLGLAILGAPLPDPGERNPVVTSEVRVILATAMERDRARRYPSALAFAEDLRRIREFEPIQARPAGPWLRLRRWCRREPATAITVAALTVGIALVSVALKINGQLLDESNENLSLAEGRLRLATAQNYSSHLAGFQARSPAGALALALEAHELVDTWWTRSGVVAPLQETSLDLVLRVPTGRAWDADTLRTAEGEVLLAGSMEGFVSLFDLEAGEVLARRQLAIEGGAPGDLRGVEVLGDGGSALVTSTDGWLRRLALPDLADVFAVDPGVGPLVWMQVDEPRGRVFVLGRGGGIAQLDLSSGAVQRRMAVPEQSAAELVLVPDASGLGFPEGLLITGPRVRSGEGRVQAETLRVLAAAGGDLLATLDLTARVHLFCWTSGALYVADIEGRLVRIGLEA
ncbi:serine/threonine-protein kinase, partial [Planctomycetota bacterium]|nr:serine/threonine-protein kinase [Planctomycetota bacterium]